MQAIETAKSSVGSCTLSTGVMIGEKIIKEVTFREITGIEEDILASKMTNTKKLNTVMANCMMSFGDIQDRQSFLEIVQKMLTADRWIYLIALRAHSLGSSYKFDSVCPSCSKKDSLIYDLFDVKIENAPSADKLFSEFTLSNGMEVRIKAGDGFSDELIEKQMNAQNAITAAIFSRISEISKKPPVFSEIQKLSMKDRKLIRDKIDELEGDLDDNYKAVCPHCSHEYEQRLPLDAISFFYQ